MSRVLPILFNMEMVRAILDGRKSCTRRIIKPQPQGYFEVSEEPLYIYDTDGKQGKITPPYQPGDILYVRETWGYPIALNSDKQYIFRADEVAESGFKNDSHIWHPSIHMPKEAARIWLKVTNVRVERLHEMWASDVPKEGIYFNKPTTADEMLMAFAKLWNSTIKKSDINHYGWDANPWVWVIEFERCEKPEGV